MSPRRNIARPGKLRFFMLHVMKFNTKTFLVQLVTRFKTSKTGENRAKGSF